MSLLRIPWYWSTLASDEYKDIWRIFMLMYNFSWKCGVNTVHVVLWWCDYSSGCHLARAVNHPAGTRWWALCTAVLRYPLCSLWWCGLQALVLCSCKMCLLLSLQPCLTVAGRHWALRGVWGKKNENINHCFRAGSDEMSAQIYLSRSVQWFAAGKWAPAWPLHAVSVEVVVLEFAVARLWYLPCGGLFSGQGVWLLIPWSTPALTSPSGALSCLFFSVSQNQQSRCRARQWG